MKIFQDIYFEKPSFFILLKDTSVCEELFDILLKYILISIVLLIGVCVLINKTIGRDRVYTTPDASGW